MESTIVESMNLLDLWEPMFASAQSAVGAAACIAFATVQARRVARKLHPRETARAAVLRQLPTALDRGEDHVNTAQGTARALLETALPAEQERAKLTPAGGNGAASPQTPGLSVGGQTPVTAISPVIPAAPSAPLTKDEKLAIWTEIAKIRITGLAVAPVVLAVLSTICGCEAAARVVARARAAQREQESQSMMASFLLAQLSNHLGGGGFGSVGLLAKDGKATIGLLNSIQAVVRAARASVESALPSSFSARSKMSADDIAAIVRKTAQEILNVDWALLVSAYAEKGPGFMEDGTRERRTRKVVRKIRRKVSRAGSVSQNPTTATDGDKKIDGDQDQHAKEGDHDTVALKVNGTDVSDENGLSKNGARAVSHDNLSECSRASNGGTDARSTSPGRSWGNGSVGSGGYSARELLERPSHATTSSQHRGRSPSVPSNIDVVLGDAPKANAGSTADNSAAADGSAPLNQRQTSVVASPAVAKTSRNVNGGGVDGSVSDGEYEDVLEEVEETDDEEIEELGVEPISAEEAEADKLTFSILRHPSFPQLVRHHAKVLLEQRTLKPLTKAVESCGTFDKATEEAVLLQIVGALGPVVGHAVDTPVGFSERTKEFATLFATANIQK